MAPSVTDDWSPGFGSRNKGSRSPGGVQGSVVIEREEVVGGLDDRADFVAFVRAQTPALLRSAHLMTGDAHSAEELVQDTFTRLYPKWSRVRAAELPVAYVRRAMVNRLVSQRRRRAAAEVVLAELPERAQGGDPVGAFAEREALWALLVGLPARQRAALVLRFYEDLPDEEIAAALRCRPGTVRSLISRGTADLRRRVEGSERARPWPGGER